MSDSTLRTNLDDIGNGIVAAYESIPLVGPLLARRARRRIRAARAADADWIAARIAGAHPELHAGDVVEFTDLDGSVTRFRVRGYGDRG